MRFHPTVASLPELESIPPEDRRRMLRNARCPGPIRLWVLNVAQGVVLAGVLMILVHAFGLQDMLAGPLGLAALLIAAIVCTICVHLVTITRIQRQIRRAIAEATAGDRTPICLSCGFDCAESEGDRCPECGASLLISTSGRPLP